MRHILHSTHLINDDEAIVWHIIYSTITLVIKEHTIFIHFLIDYIVSQAINVIFVEYHSFYSDFAEFQHVHIPCVQVFLNNDSHQLLHQHGTLVGTDTNNP